MTIARLTAAMAALVLPATVVRADGGDAAYCRALASTYARYVVKDERGHTVQRGSVEGSAALEQCRVGNVAGIPVLERLLRDAKVELPPRG